MDSILESDGWEVEVVVLESSLESGGGPEDLGRSDGMSGSNVDEWSSEMEVLESSES
jgi:hypothetical protein